MRVSGGGVHDAHLGAQLLGQGLDDAGAKARPWRCSGSACRPRHQRPTASSFRLIALVIDGDHPAAMVFGKGVFEAR